MVFLIKCMMIIISGQHTSLQTQEVEIGIPNNDPVHSAQQVTFYGKCNTSTCIAIKCVQWLHCSPIMYYVTTLCIHLM